MQAQFHSLFKLSSSIFKALIQVYFKPWLKHNASLDSSLIETLFQALIQALLQV